MYELPREKQATKSAKSNTNKSKRLRPDTPLRYCPGIGPMRAQKLEKKGLSVLADLLYLMPIRYEDRSQLHTPSDISPELTGKTICVWGKITSFQAIPTRHRKMFKATVANEGSGGGLLECTWFHSYKGMEQKFRVGAKGIFTGKLSFYRSIPQLSHPDFESSKDVPLSASSAHWGKIVPIYPLTAGITQKWYRDLCFRTLPDCMPLIEDKLPLWLREENQLPALAQALQEIHFPSRDHNLRPTNSAHLPPCVRRLVFEEFFLFQLALMLEREDSNAKKGFFISPSQSLEQSILARLPFSLTSSQKQVAQEIYRDLASTEPMNRIVQGDVGCGKTIVALLVAAQVMQNNLQVALLAPTEVLAEQHYKEASLLFDQEKIALLTGSKKKIEKAQVIEKVKSGEIQLVIGTHALLQDKVKWQQLGMAIIDEQHRFGVKQRTHLLGTVKGEKTPHMLTMTATPIPRSLALTVCGELKISTIDDLPPGRKPILTKVLQEKERHRLYKLIQREVAKGFQAYIVYPLVEDSDKEGMQTIKSVESELTRLSNGPLKGLKLAMVHGKMPAEDRNRIMQEFKAKMHDVLLSTTVIEVGVNVPNAVVMGIENAERFGLSQLHQLRGRVGRGAAKSFCVLCTNIPRLKNQEEEDSDSSTWQRLEIMEKSQDGFYIAEADLKIRGPGEILGTRQSGSPHFRLGDMQRDSLIIEDAKQAAIELLRRDPKLQRREHNALANYFEKLYEFHQDALKSG